MRSWYLRNVVTTTVVAEEDIPPYINVRQGIETRSVGTANVPMTDEMLGGVATPPAWLRPHLAEAV